MMESLIVVRSRDNSIRIDYDLDDAYDKDDSDGIEWATHKLEDLLKDDRFCKPGHRNDSIVDAMIYCHAIGADCHDVVNACFNAGWIDSRDKFAAEDKIDVVAPYLDDWFWRGVESAKVNTIESLG